MPNEIIRGSTDHQRNSLKAATKRGVRAAGRAESFQHATRVSAAQISHYCNNQYPEFIPVDVALDADIDAGDPIITRAMAEMQGYTLVPVDPISGEEISVEDIIRINAEAGDVNRQYADSMADGTISPDERRRLIQELLEVEAAAREARMKLEAAGGRPALVQEAAE